MFLIVTLIQAIKNISDGMIVQRVSRKVPRATDFRLIQGSIYANGTGILMSGVAGTPPTSTYPSLTVPLVNVTGVATRSVGYAMAGILLLVAFLPKINGALLTIPNPVLGGFLVFALGLVFIEGIQTLVRAGLDPQKSMVAGLAFGDRPWYAARKSFGWILAGTVGNVARKRDYRGYCYRHCPDHIGRPF